MVTSANSPDRSVRTMSPADTFRRVLAAAAQALRNHGFTRYGQSFYLRGANDWGVLSFQKSVHNGPDLHRFTLNLGVYSGRLDRTGSLPDEKPSVWDCHWQDRLGTLVHGRDEWWEITSSTDADALAREVAAAILHHALPQLARQMSDEALRDYCLSGRRPTNMGDLAAKANLAVLLQSIGPEEQLPPLLADVRRHPDDDLHWAGFRFDADRIVPLWRPRP